MDKRDRLGLLGSLLASLSVLVICVYLVSSLAFNHDNALGITRILSEMESNGALRDLSNLAEELSNLKIPLISEADTGWTWLNPIITGLNMIVGFFTGLISFMSVIVVFLLAAFSLL